MKIGLALLGIILAGFATGALGAFAVNALTGDNGRIKEFYLTENAVHVSPHSLRKGMDEGKDNFVLVDLRSAEEYEKEHVVGAVNIPAYSDKDTADYDKERIVAAFKRLPKGKDVIVYCYSMACMTGRKVGKMLAEEGVYVKHLGIGWNEWRYYWELWNHEGEWNSTVVGNYVAVGSEPGKPVIKNKSSACPIAGEFAC